VRLAPHSGFTMKASTPVKNDVRRGQRPAFGGAPCHRDMALSKRRNKMSRDRARTYNLLIAVDGPAASGKGTIARALAKHFGLPHMDTGLLYRAVALKLWRWGGDPNVEFEALRACEDLGSNPDDEELRSEPVSRIASKVSSYP